MSWISTISYDRASGALKSLYERIKGPDNNVDNIMMAHSLRPHTMEGHMALYKYVLHHPRNSLAKSYLETIGVCVSLLNKCPYCVEHHYAGLRRLLDDDKRASAMRAALEAGDLSACFEGKELAGIEYAVKLTVDPSALGESDIEAMRSAGLDDGEILEINQVASYFSYANRTVLGLGVHVEGDIIGLSPNDSEDPDNWTHQ